MKTCLKRGRKWVALFMCLAMLAGMQVAVAQEEKLDTAVWFADVNFWNPPTKWNTDPSTVTGQMTEHSGLVFDMDIPAEDGASKLSLMMIGGDIPDVISLTDSKLMQQLVDSGLVWDLDEFLATYDPESHLINGGFPEDMKKVLIERDGGWYCYSQMDSKGFREIYPAMDDYYNDYVNYWENSGVMFNRSVMEALGLTIEDLQTEEQVLSAFKLAASSDVKVNDQPIIPLLVDGNSYQEFTMKALYYLFGAMPVNDEGNYQNILYSSEAKHALSFLNTCARNGYMDPNQFTIDNSGVKSSIASDRVFCFIGNKANTGAGDMEGDWRGWTTPGPILSSEGTSPVLAKTQQAYAGWFNTFIAKDCAHPEKIAKWLSYVTSEQGLIMNLYGFEGVDYNLTEKGQLVLTQTGLENAANYTNTGIGAYWPIACQSLQNRMIPAPAEDSKEAADMRILCALGKNEHTVIYDSVVLDIPDSYIDSSSDLGLIKSQLENYQEAQIAITIMAKTDEDFEKSYEDMLSKMNELGNAQLDAKLNERYHELCEIYGITLVNPNVGKHTWHK